MADNPIEEIKRQLKTKGKVYVNDLSGHFGVSKVSVRKYLAKLEEQGFATRFYGGAALNRGSGGESGLPGYYGDPLLSALAEQAGKMISDGDSIFIGSGRTCCLLARELEGKKNLTVVTNNITALPDLIKNSSRVFLIGGEVTTTDSSTLFSSWESPELMMENIYVTKAFTSTSGIDLKAGITVDSVISTHIFKHIPTMAQQWYLMADSGKYDKISIYSVAELGQISGIITDALPSSYEKEFKARGVDICLVNPAFTVHDGE